jgi:hypothetical protein
VPATAPPPQLRRVPRLRQSRRCKKLPLQHRKTTPRKEAGDDTEDDEDGPLVTPISTKRAPKPRYMISCMEPITFCHIRHIRHTRHSRHTRHIRHIRHICHIVHTVHILYIVHIYHILHILHILYFRLTSVVTVLRSSASASSKLKKTTTIPIAVANKLATDRQRIEAFTHTMKFCQLRSIPAKMSLDQFASI